MDRGRPALVDVDVLAAGAGGSLTAVSDLADACADDEDLHNPLPMP